MHCRVCGTELNGIVYRPSKRQVLCNACNRTTPQKVSRERFDEYYWAGQANTVPSSTRQSFYQDYLASEQTLEGYTKATTSEW